MNLMSKVENIELIGSLMRHFIESTDKVKSIFDLEDGLSRSVWMDNCVEKLKQDSD